MPGAFMRLLQAGQVMEMAMGKVLNVRSDERFRRETEASHRSDGVGRSVPEVPHGTVPALGLWGGGPRPLGLPIPYPGGNRPEG
jgi:hypothetical protein